MRVRICDDQHVSIEPNPRSSSRRELELAGRRVVACVESGFEKTLPEQAPDRTDIVLGVVSFAVDDLVNAHSPLVERGSPQGTPAA